MTVSFRASALAHLRQPALHGQSYCVMGHLLITPHSLKLYDTADEALHQTRSASHLSIEDPALLEFIHRFQGGLALAEIHLQEVLLIGRLGNRKGPVSLQQCAYLRWIEDSGPLHFIQDGQLWKLSERDPLAR